MPSRRPQDLVFTLFGDFLLHRPGPVWVGALIRLLGPLGLSESSVRTVLSRMSSKGWLESERRGRNSFYRLTERGRALLKEGEERIYRPPRGAEWDGLWTLVTYTIPEDERTLRDRLRVRLQWLGLGSLGGGLWITPHDVGDRIGEVAGELDLLGRIEVFRGEHRGFSEPAEIVDAAWELEEINARYEAFVDDHLPEYRHYEAQLEEEKLSEPDAFVRRFDLVHEYREFPLLDPYLPFELQPEGWAGECAAALFQRLRDLLKEPADRYVEGLLERTKDELDAPAVTGTA